MKKAIEAKKNKSNQSDKIQLDNIMNTNNDIIYPISNKINDKDIINDYYSKKNSNKFSINFLNMKKKRILDREKKLVENYNHKIKIDLSDEDNNINENENLNITNHFEMLNDKIIDIIKSDIFDYDKNFEKDIKKNMKKNFWKNLIFRKFGGQNKLLLEIIKEIKKYEHKNYKKNKIENCVINIKTENFEKKQENENELLYDNTTAPQQKTNNIQNRNNIIVIQLDDDDENEEDKNNNNNEVIEKEENEEKINDKYNISDIYNYKNIKNYENLTENEKLLIEIYNLKGLETESKFLKNFLYNENYFLENNIFFPEDFDDDEITNDIIEENSILRQTISLKLYASLKLVFPSLDKGIFQKNITYLENLAYTIDKMIGNSYLLIIDIIFSRIKEEAIKIKQKKSKTKSIFY